MTVDVLDAERLRGSLTPLRRRLLEELREPASATGLAARLGATRQRINYHLRELEKGGLVELVEVRQRRGRQERLMRARTVVVAPAVIGGPPPDADARQDRFAVDTLLATTARTVETVARQRVRAQEQGKRLLTFTVEAEIGFARPADLETFATRLAELIAVHDDPQAKRRYRVVAAAHPQEKP